MKEKILYHNPRWGKSREAVQLLKTEGVDFSIVEYQKKIITEDEILEISRKLGLRPKDFVRKFPASNRVTSKYQKYKFYMGNTYKSINK